MDQKSNTVVSVNIERSNLDVSEFITLLEPAFELDGVNYLTNNQELTEFNIAQLSMKLSEIRGACLKIMQSSAFQKLYIKFCESLSNRYLTNDALFQRTPSIRLSLPEALGTSWHTDNWYGHSPNSMTFWVPLTELCAGSGVSFINDISITGEVENMLERNAKTLQEINQFCDVRGEEILCEFGEFLCFGARTLHGSVINTSQRFRCSFDFRAIPDDSSFGSKSASNYQRIKNVAKVELPQVISQTFSLKYINGSKCGAKYQHMLIESYAASAGLVIVRNEAEIETVETLPVLMAYSIRDVPNPGEIDHIICYSLDCLIAAHGVGKRILETAVENKVSIHFVLEDLVFPSNTSLKHCLKNLI